MSRAEYNVDGSVTDGVVHLVLGIARLGENDLRGWWNGHALDRTGRYVLEGIFRRTWKPAALELDVAAAAGMHAQLLGRPTALHLFSDLLPFKRWATGWLSEQKTTLEPHPLLETLEGWTQEDSVASLRGWCGGADGTRGEALGDGLLLGRLTSAEITDPGMLQQTARLLAAAYLDQNRTLRPPYFDLAR